MTGWKWTGETNPIVQCVIGLEFAEQFPQPVIESVGKAYARLKDTLPRRMVHQPVVIQPGAHFAPRPQQDIKGFLFDRVKENGEQERSLNVINNQVIYTTASYDRWENVWKDAKAAIAEVFNITASDNQVSAVFVSYTDRFYFDGSIDDARAGAVLRKNKYISENSFDCHSLWHCHHGFFSNDFRGTALDNIKINVVDREDIEDQQKKRSIEITTYHKLIFTQSFEDAMSSEDNKFLIVEEELNKLHEKNKEVLREVLTPEICSRISGLIGDVQ